MTFRVILLATLLSMVIGVAVAETADTLKISVLADGRMLADGRPVTLEELEPMLAKLAKDNGTVIYYREDPSQDEPHQNAKEVTRLVIESRLPISFSTEPDFSTVVDGEGNVRKR